MSSNETPKVMHPITFENGTVYLLKVFPLEKKPGHFMIGTNTFFKMLGYESVPPYSEAMVEEIAEKLKARTEWVRVRRAIVEYTPRTQRKVIRLQVFDMRKQHEYEVLMGKKARPFDVAQQKALKA